MKRLLLAVLVAGFAFNTAAVQAQSDEPEESSGNDRADARRDNEKFCMTETGSRVTASRNARSKKAEQECATAGGRVYTRKDIDRSGAVDLKDALRRLDPSIR